MEGRKAPAIPCKQQLALGANKSTYFITKTQTIRILTVKSQKLLPLEFSHEIKPSIRKKKKRWEELNNNQLLNPHKSGLTSRKTSQGSNNLDLPRDVCVLKKKRPKPQISDGGTALVFPEEEPRQFRDNIPSTRI